MHSSKRIIALVATILMSLMLSGVTFAQNFEFFTGIVNQTGQSQALVIQAFRINGSPAAEGDEIGVFDGNLLVGRAKIVGSTITPPAVAAIMQFIPPVGPPLPGAITGNTILYRAWQKSSGTETDATPSYTVGNGLFAVGALQVLQLDAAIAQVQRTLTTNVNPAGSGSVTRSPDQPTYDNGTPVDLTAVPAAGFRFVNWTGDIGGATATDASITVTMDQDRTVTANFEVIPQFTLTTNVNPAGGGSVTRNPDQTSYSDGTLVDLTAVPATGFEFVNWTGDIGAATATDVSITVTMDQNRTVTANFQPIQRTLTTNVNPRNSGSVTRNPDQTTYDNGTTVDLTAVPAAGFEFVNWTGDIGGATATDVSIAVTMDQDRTVTANFQPIQRTLTMAVNPAGSGTTDPAAGQHTFNDGTVVPITATPNAGFEFVNWTGDVADPNSATTSVTMNADKTVTANFAAVRTLTMAVNPAGSGTTDPAAGQHTFSDGTVVPITATPNAGFEFVNWTGDVTDPNSATTSVTMNADKTVTANFQPIPRTLTMAVNPAGSGTTDPAVGQHTFDNGTVVPITATANTGFVFVNWTGDVADPNSATTSVTMDADKTVTANFAPVRTLTMAVNPAGSGTTDPPVGQHIFGDGEVVPITATANAGFEFVNWTGDVADPNSATTSVTMNADKTVTANFAPVRTLTMAVNPAGSGTTDPAVGQHTFSDGTVVPITATPNAGFEFVNWTGDVADPNNPSTTVTMNADKTVTANFQPIPRTLTMAVNPAGSGTTDPAVGQHTFDNGTVVPITATANAGFVFVNWTGDVADPNSATTSVTMDADKTVTANFAPVRTLTMAVNPAGSGTTDPAEGQHIFGDGQVVPITATPNAGFEFVNWTGDVADPNSASTSVTMDADKTVTANFAPIRTLTMAVSPAGSGTTDPAVGQHTFRDGTVVPITATPNAGFEFVNWTGDVADPSSATTTVTMDADKTVTANFQPIPRTLTMAVNPVGSGTTDPAVGQHIFDNGTVVPIQATANRGFVFVNWTGDVADPNSPSTTVTMDADKTVTANFAPLRTLTMVVNPAGSGTTDPTEGQHTFADGTVVPITATPNAGFEFVNWTGDVADPNSATTSVTMNADKTVTANFAPVRTLTMVVNPAGSGTTDPAEGQHTFRDGTVVPITATPNAGFEFVNWTGDVADPNSASTTVTMDADKTVTANFRPIPRTLTMAVNPAKSGTTDPAVGQHIFDNGTVVPVSATANPGFVFVNWTGDVADPNSATTTVTMDADKTVTANFVEERTLTMAVNPAGTGTTDPAEGQHTFADGTVVPISASANSGFEFVNWTGDVADPNSASTTVTMDADKTVTANFQELVFFCDLSVDPTSHDFGDVDTQSFADKTFVLSNDADATANCVGSLDIDGDPKFSIVSGETFDIAPGETHEFVVRFDCRQVEPEDPAAIVTISSNDPNGDLTVEVIGNCVAVPDIAANRTQLIFEDTPVDSVRELTSIIGNLGDADLVITRVSLAGEHEDEFELLSFDVPATLAPGEQEQVTVRFTRNSIGNKISRVKIESNDPDEGQFIIKVRAPDAGVVAKQLDFDDAADTFLDGRKIDRNHGLTQFLRVGNSGTPRRRPYRTLIEFDFLADLQACGVATSDQIVSARLEMHVFRSSGDDPDGLLIDAFRVNRDWTEGISGTSPAAMGEATYRSAKHDVEDWAGRGSAGVPADREGDPDDTQFVSSPRKIIWDLTDSVQDIFDSQQDHGWLLQSQDERKDKYFRFYSSEHPDEDRRPRLVIVVEVSGMAPASLSKKQSDTPDLQVQSESTAPDDFALQQNYPNPFNPETQIRYEIASPATVSLTVFDVTGAVVRRLLDRANTPVGSFSVVWDGRDASGRASSSGVYFYRIFVQPQDGETAPFAQTRRMVLLK